MAAPPGSPQISPDGHYWWDGQAWQPMPAAAAAPAPAEQQPSWLAAPLPAAAAPAPASAPVAYAPQPVYEQQPAPAAWMPPEPPRSRLTTYVTALVLIAVLGAGGYVAWQMTSHTDYTASVQASPSPTMSDYERADRFLNVDLGPALIELNDAAPGVSKNCNANLPPSCKDALITFNTAMIDLGNAIQNNQKDIPVCIGVAVDQFKNDWQTMEQGLSTAIQGFNQNNRTLIIDGIQRYGEVSPFLRNDIDRINKAEQTCSKTI
jgi:hypothetical protein